MYESGMYTLDESDYELSEPNDTDVNDNQNTVNIDTVEQVSNAAGKYADRVASQLSQGFEIYPLTKTWGISNKHIKNAFSVIGALALLNVARKNKLITAGLLSAGYVYAVNTKKAPKSTKEVLQNLA